MGHHKPTPFNGRLKLSPGIYPMHASRQAGRGAVQKSLLNFFEARGNGICKSFNSNGFLRQGISTGKLHHTVFKVARTNAHTQRDPL